MTLVKREPVTLVRPKNLSTLLAEIAKVNQKGGTLVLDSLGMSSFDVMDEIVTSEGLARKSALVPAVPRIQDYMSLANNLRDLIQALCAKTRLGMYVVVIAPEDRVEVLRDGVPQSTYFEPLILGKSIPKILGNYFNAIGRMVLKQKMGNISREIVFLDPVSKSKAQGALFDECMKNRGAVPADLDEVFKLLGAPSSILLYGNNGTGKSFAAAHTSPKPVTILYTEPVTPLFLEERSTNNGN